MSTSEAMTLVTHPSFSGALDDRIEATQVDTVVGVEERTVQEWLAHLMNKVTALKEQNGTL